VFELIHCMTVAELMDTLKGVDMSAQIMIQWEDEKPLPTLHRRPGVHVRVVERSDIAGQPLTLEAVILSGPRK